MDSLRELEVLTQVRMVEDLEVYLAGRVYAPIIVAQRNLRGEEFLLPGARSCYSHGCVFAKDVARAIERVAGGEYPYFPVRFGSLSGAGFSLDEIPLNGEFVRVLQATSDSGAVVYTNRWVHFGRGVCRFSFVEDTDGIRTPPNSALVNLSDALR